MKNQGSEQSDQKAAYASAQKKIGQIIEQTVSKHKHGDGDLSEIVCDAAGNTDAGTAEATELFEQNHDQETECCAGKTVEEHGKISEGEGGQQYPGQGDGNCCRNVKLI